MSPCRVCGISTAALARERKVEENSKRRDTLRFQKLKGILYVQFFQTPFPLWCGKMAGPENYCLARSLVLHYFFHWNE